MNAYVLAVSAKYWNIAHRKKTIYSELTVLNDCFKMNHIDILIYHFSIVALSTLVSKTKYNME